MLQSAREKDQLIAELKSAIEQRKPESSDNKSSACFSFDFN